MSRLSIILTWTGIGLTGLTGWTGWTGWTGLCLGCDALGANGEAKGQANSETVRWTFDAPVPRGLEDSRDEVPLSDLEGEWRQLFAREANAATPELYPRTPEARLLRREGKSIRSACLRTHGAQVLIVSRPKKVPDWPRFRLRAAVDSSGLGNGSVEAAVRFLARDGAAVLGEETVRAARSCPIELEGSVPPGTSFAAVSLWLLGSPADATCTLLVDSVELEILPGLRVETGRRFPLFDDGEAVAFDISAFGVARGRCVLSYEVSRVWLEDIAGDISGDLSSDALREEEDPRLKIRFAGELEGWATLRRPATWSLEFPSKGASHLPQGSYRITFRVEGAERATRLSESISFAVLPLSPASPRSLWREAAARLPASGSYRYAGAVRTADAVRLPDGDPPLHAVHAVHAVHAFAPRGRVGPLLLMASSPPASRWAAAKGLVERGFVERGLVEQGFIAAPGQGHLAFLSAAKPGAVFYVLDRTRGVVQGRAAPERTTP